MSRGRIVARLVSDGRVVAFAWEAGRIIALAPTDEVADDAVLAPTLFDTQVNGFASVDFQQERLPIERLEHALRALRAGACGGIMLTCITCPWEALLARVRHYRALLDRLPLLAATVAGFHIEGPFLSSEPGFRGAHDPRWMIDPSAERLAELRAAAGDAPLLVTLAPERHGAIDAIRAAAALGITVSLGHTAASASIIGAAVVAGARAFTHLGNGMPNAIDRHDNVLWNVLDGSGLVIGLIPDGIHVSPPLFRLIHRLGSEIHYTTDAIAAAGAPPGRYRLAGLELEVGADQVVREPGASHFAGSALTPLQGVFRAARMLGQPWQEAWVRAATIPRRLVGVSDPLAVGRPADFCVIRGRDAALSVTVFADGCGIAHHVPPW